MVAELFTGHMTGNSQAQQKELRHVVWLACGKAQVAELIWEQCYDSGVGIFAHRVSAPGSSLSPRGCFLKASPVLVLVMISYYLLSGIAIFPLTLESKKKGAHGSKGGGHAGVIGTSAVISATN